jgi:hypothetical protein
LDNHQQVNNDREACDRTARTVQPGNKTAMTELLGMAAMAVQPFMRCDYRTAGTGDNDRTAEIREDSFDRS